MKKFLFVVLLGMLVSFSNVYAGEAYQVWASTAYATIFGNPCRVDTISIESSTNTIQTIIFYDNTTEKWRTSVAPYDSTYGVGTKNVHIGSYIRFLNNVRVKCTDTYGNNKVKVQIVAE